MNARLATLNDVALLAAMNQQLIRDEGHRNRMSLGQLEDRMQAWLSGEYQAAIFEESGEAVGYALFKREPEWIYLRQFFVVPSKRRQGIGRKAMDWLKENVWRNSPRIRLDVLVGNPTGIAFWRSLGFADYALTMELDLLK
ncbi:MAG TPA: GNAT family N-acetyltransferase [Pirellulales bacterium]|nr:GNAT family N-acetyltransferase [Pirellulales bacterium]